MNTNPRSIVLAGLFLSSLLVGCAASFGEPPDASPSDAPPSDASPSDEPDASRPPFATTGPLESEAAMPGMPADIPDAAWTAILADLSEVVGQPVESPTVLSAESLTYNDGSLGCPEPGQMYTQALVDGYRVIVEADGEEYDYRIGRGTDVRLCESGSTLSNGDNS
ncbi:MAG: hypothetical protein ACR2I5_04105 [Candidatus Limnocylindria bacterium]